MGYESPIAVDNITTCTGQSVMNAMCCTSPVHCSLIHYDTAVVQDIPVTLSVKLPIAPSPPVAVT